MNENAIILAKDNKKTTKADEAPVDMDQLRLFTNGDQEEEKALANLFLQQAWEMIAVLEKGIKDQNNDAWKSAAHRLKGSSGNFGATRLYHLCQRAEANHQDSADKKVEMLSALKQETQRVDSFFLEAVPA